MLLWLLPCLVCWTPSAVAGIGAGDTTSLTLGAGDKELRLLVLLPEKSGEKKLPFGAEMSGTAVFSAFDQIEREQLLSDYVLKADFADSGCNAVKGIGQAYEMLRRENYTGIIGPSCSQVCRFVGRLAAHLNIPCFSGLCQDVEMGKKSEFKTLTRFLATFEMTGFAVSELLARYNWQRVGIIAERQSDIIWLLTRNGLHHALGERDVTIAASTLMMSVEDELETTLKATAAVSRVIILAMHGDSFRQTLKLAAKLGYLNGEYFFICISYYKQRKSFGIFHWNLGLEDDDVIKSAFTSVFLVDYFNRDDSEEYSRFTGQVKNGSMTYFGYEYGEREEVPYPAANLYEATYLLAVAINETTEAGHDVMDGEQLARRLWGRSFPSLTGGVVLNENGDREQAYMIRHVQDEDSGELETIGYYHSDVRNLTIVPSVVTWPAGRVAPPADTPACGYENEFCEEDEQARFVKVIMIFSGSLIAVVILASVSITVIYRHLKWQKDLGSMAWKIEFKNILFNKGSIWNSSRRLSMSIASMTSGASGHNAQQFTKTALYKGNTAALRPIKHIKQVDLTDQAVLTELKQLHDLSHANVARFIGVCLDGPSIQILTEYCVKGSLQDLTENDDIQLDWSFKRSIMNDIAQGLGYLHNSFQKYHGNLKSSNCVVDSRFVIKLTDFALPRWDLYSSEPKDKLWTAPELLQKDYSLLPATAKGDIYSYGIVMHEIICREGVFYVKGKDLEPTDILDRLIEPPSSSQTFRPSADDVDCPLKAVELMTSCWHQQPEKRPSIQAIKATLVTCGGDSGKSFNIMDNLLSRMEQYASNLEGLVGERTSQYLEEKRRAELLLHRLLPPVIADDLQKKGYVKPVSYESVTIYFSDVVHFTALCSESTPMQVVNMLNDLYTLFDEVIEGYDVYKVETIGDAYMAVSGLPTSNGIRHAHEIACMSLSLVKAVKQFKIRHKPDRQLQVRVGLHSGPCVAGVVGLTMPRYCLFGDTVNTAARMESNGEALKINMSDTTVKLLLDRGGFEFEYRGEVEMKGKGLMRTYFLLSGPECAGQK